MCRVVYPVLLDRTATKDVVQDVYLSIWKNRKTLKIHSTIEGYLYRACVLRALDEVRRIKSKNTKLAHLKEQTQTTHNPTEEEMNLHILQEDISKAVNELREPTKTIFILKRYSELKNREIANQLEVSIKTVEKHMTIALKHMRMALKQYIK